MRMIAAGAVIAGMMVMAMMRVMGIVRVIVMAVRVVQRVLDMLGLRPSAACPRR